MTAFTLWYCAIAVGHLSRESRLDLLRIVYWIFTNLTLVRISAVVGFLFRLQVFGIDEKPSVFFVEIRDLVGSLNTIVFVSRVIREYDDVTLNRLGTHPVENLFGMIRLACHENHPWDRFRSEVAKGGRTGDLLEAHGLNWTDSARPCQSPVSATFPTK
jgi:hypothetical protein